MKTGYVLPFCLRAFFQNFSARKWKTCPNLVRERGNLRLALYRLQSYEIFGDPLSTAMRESRLENGWETHRIDERQVFMNGEHRFLSNVEFDD